MTETCTSCGHPGRLVDGFVCNHCYAELKPEKEWDEGPDEFDWRADRDADRRESEMRERHDYPFAACYGRRPGGLDAG